MKKNFYLIFLGFFALSLAACGGGGGGGGYAGAGGGGGNGSRTPAPAISLSTQARSTPVGTPSSWGAALGNGFAKEMTKGLTASKPADGLNGFTAYATWSGDYIWNVPETVKISANNGVIKLDSSLLGQIDLTPSDFTKFANGLVGTTLRVANDPVRFEGGGNWAAGYDTYRLLLGGTSVELDYTNFGYWAYDLPLHGQINGKNVDTILSAVRPFVLVSNGATPKLPPQNSTFSGTVLASASQTSNNDSGNITVPLVGKASLTVPNNSVFRIEKLRFEFDNFYTLNAFSYYTGDSLYGDNGSFSFNRLSADDAHKNTTGITIPITRCSISGGPCGLILNGSLSGQFYGNSAGSTATEAVGIFSVGASESDNSKTVNVSGAFGVKKE